MNSRFYQSFYPYFIAGAVIVLGFFAFFLISILFVKALIIGGIIFSGVWLKNKFFPSKIQPKRHYEHTDQPAEDGKRKPITFEHGEY